MSDRATRTQLRTAIGFGALVVLALVAALVSNALRSNPAPRPTTSPTGLASNSCTGAKPNPPLRDPGPFQPPQPDTTDPESIYVARISTYCGDFLFKIDPLEAPIAARSFVFLARKKFYDSLEFDRVASGVGLFGGKGNAGYGLVDDKRGPAIAKGDLVMLDIDPGARITLASPFVISDGGRLDGVRVGTPPDPDAVRQNTETLQRFFELLRFGPARLAPLYIVHVEIQEFTR
jgi:hypothetical protein